MIDINFDFTTDAEGYWEEFDDQNYEDGYDEAYDYWEEMHE